MGRDQLDSVHADGAEWRRFAAYGYRRLWSVGLRHGFLVAIPCEARHRHDPSESATVAFDAMAPMFLCGTRILGVDMTVWRHRLFVSSIALVLLGGVIGIAYGQTLPPGGTFIDDDGNIHEGNIEAIAAVGITKGCNPPANDMFCPEAVVTRGAMAAFLVRALDLSDDGGGNVFVDDDGMVFEGDIDKLGTAGITKGCNPPTNDMFCPDAPVTRGAMAAFLVRGLGLSDDGGGDLFIDDDGLVFEIDIDKLGTAGVTKGCNPPVNDMFCPSSEVTRAQMASFLARALDLDPIVPPPPTTSTTMPTTTTTVAPTTTTMAPMTAEVSIVDFSFSPDPVSISVGESVVWTNDGGALHTSTSGTSPAGDGMWGSTTLSPGDTFSQQFDQAGTFEYFCMIHPATMQGTVTVTN